jgi:hypothetical protein
MGVRSTPWPLAPISANFVKIVFYNMLILL